MKNPVNHVITGFLVDFDVQKVESGRIELPSKQVTKELSSRLVFSCFFDCKLAKDNPLTTYLF